MLAAITRDEVLDLLASQLPSAIPSELGRAATALHLILKAGATPAMATKPAARKPRQYREKSVAESQKLKR